jgi:hypothetical protein
MSMTIAKAPLPEKKRDGLTLHQLAQFVQEAHRQDIDPECHVKVVATMRSRLAHISVTDEAHE